jgi:hypothetical protein
MPGDKGSPRQCPWMKDLELGKEVRWMNSKVSYKQGESDNIIEVKLGLKAKSQGVLRWLLPSPLIGGWVPES